MVTWRTLFDVGMSNGVYKWIGCPPKLLSLLRLWVSLTSELVAINSQTGVGN